MIIDSPIVSGSASASGSLNQHGDIVITGSLTVTGPITGALTGSVDSASFASTAISSSYAASATSASYAISATSSSYANDATSASYAVNASFLNGSGSGEFTPTGSFNTFSSSILTYTGSNDTNISNIHSTTASLNTSSGSAITRLNSIESTTGSLNVASGSAITRLNALEVTSGSNITRINALEVASGSAITRLNALEVTSGSNITRISALESASGSAITRLNSIESTTGSLNIFSGSAQSQLTSLQAQTGSYATTGSNTFIGTQTITGSVLQSGSLSVNGCITSTGQIVAQTINVQQVTSSVVYSCGDNIFGTILSNSQTFTGSMFITGSNFRATVGTACFSGTVCAPAFVGGTISGTTATFSGALSLGSNTNYILFGTNPSVNPYIQGGSDDALYLGTGNLPRLTISPTGAATFSSSVTANSLVIKNSGVPAAQLFRDLDVISVGSAGQGIEFGARNGSTLTAGAAIYGGLDNPATTGTLVFQTMCNSSLSTKMTITSCGNVSIGVSDPDIFARGDARNVGIGASGASDNLALQLNAGGSGGRGAQIYMGQGGTRHFTISSNVTESTIGTTSNTPLRFVTCDSLERLRIFNTGIACFACQVCAPAFVGGTVCGTNATFIGQVLVNTDTSTNGQLVVSSVGFDDTILRVEQRRSGYASALNLIGVNDAGAAYNYVASGTNSGVVHWRVGGNGTACTLVLSTAGNVRLTLNPAGAACFACELTAKTLGTNDLILNNLNYECANYVDGTRGSWLIQEGACDLFIINQVSCKKYKFNLIEIN